MEGAIVSKIAHLLSVFSNDADVSDFYNKKLMQWDENKLRRCDNMDIRHGVSRKASYQILIPANQLHAQADLIHCKLVIEHRYHPLCIEHGTSFLSLIAKYES